jgi:hypothetical protein
MDCAAGEENEATLRVTFDPRLKLEFHGTKITSDGGLLACRELDGVLGLSETAGAVLTDTRTGANGRHTLVGQFRQSVFERSLSSSLPVVGRMAKLASPADKISLQRRQLHASVRRVKPSCKRPFLLLGLRRGHKTGLAVTYYLLIIL